MKNTAWHPIRMVEGKSVPKFRRIAPEERRELLVQAGLACLARGGILAFTIDRICVEAGVSRGLISHHFKSKNGLLVAIYDRMIGELLQVVETPPEGTQHVLAIIDAAFAPDKFNRGSLRIWLALWGEIANNRTLLKAHRRQYARYRAGVEIALSALTGKRRPGDDVGFIALMLISLIDGLWLEWSIDPTQISPHEAKSACHRLLKPFFGEIGS